LKIPVLNVFPLYIANRGRATFNEMSFIPPHTANGSIVGNRMTPMSPKLQHL